MSNCVTTQVYRPRPSRTSMHAPPQNQRGKPAFWGPSNASGRRGRGFESRHPTSKYGAYSAFGFPESRPLRDCVSICLSKVAFYNFTKRPTWTIPAPLAIGVPTAESLRSSTRCTKGWQIATACVRPVEEAIGRRECRQKARRKQRVQRRDSLGDTADRALRRGGPVVDRWVRLPPPRRWC